MTECDNAMTGDLDLERDRERDCERVLLRIGETERPGERDAR